MYETLWGNAITQNTGNGIILLSSTVNNELMFVPMRDYVVNTQVPTLIIFFAKLKSGERTWVMNVFLNACSDMNMTEIDWSLTSIKEYL
jgi:hypothetical protein